MWNHGDPEVDLKFVLETPSLGQCSGMSPDDDRQISLTIKNDYGKSAD